VTSPGLLRKPLDVSLPSRRCRPNSPSLDVGHSPVRTVCMHPVLPIISPPPLSLSSLFLYKNPFSLVKSRVVIYWCLTDRIGCATDVSRLSCGSFLVLFCPLECLSTLLSTPHCFFPLLQVFLPRRSSRSIISVSCSHVFLRDLNPSFCVLFPG